MKFLTCSYHSEHGFWPQQYVPDAIGFAMLDHPKNPKYERMLHYKCLICGSRLVPFTPPRVENDGAITL